MGCKKSKVFGVGFHKTGTSSLAAALRELGYSVCGHIGVSRPNIADVAEDLALEHLDRYDAFQDNPWPLLYRRMDCHCPGSKFILTTRPPKEWIRSVVMHFGGTTTPMREWIYGVGDPRGNEKIYIERYEQHNREVREYFRNRPNDLLELKITQGEGWKKICPFLNEEMPSIPFPHANRGSTREVRRAIPEWLKSVVSSLRNTL
ncbi:hypothetical protein GGQ10_000918 [Salinibacter ruber]|uniref:sulfotransferase family protein n=1 Tax=Salinibacter ruber TaxID=146919 RepID=UPI002452453B|nr:hypothetical protein [Salinibacter ruber]